MGNPETKATLGSDIVQTQANEEKKHGKLKDEHVPHRKTGINSGPDKCWTLRVVHKYFYRS